MDEVDRTWWGGEILSDASWSIWQRGNQKIEYNGAEGYRLYIDGAYVESFETFEEAAARADQEIE